MVGCDLLTTESPSGMAVGSRRCSSFDLPFIAGLAEHLAGPFGGIEVFEVTRSTPSADRPDPAEAECLILCAPLLGQGCAPCFELSEFARQTVVDTIEGLKQAGGFPVWIELMALGEVVPEGFHVGRHGVASLGRPWGRVKDRNGNSGWRYQDVAIADAHNTAGEVGGEGLTGYESDAQEQKQGSNWLGTVHGISGTARTSMILLEAGRKGESGDEAIRGIGQPPDAFPRPLSNIWRWKSFPHAQCIYGWPQLQRIEHYRACRCIQADGHCTKRA